MQNFEYHNHCEIVFGKRDEKEIAKKLKEFGSKRVFVLYGQNSVVKSGLLKRITEALVEEGILYVSYGGVSANPLKEHADEGVEIAKHQEVDFILAVGGGSVIDAAKYIALAAVNDNAWEYFTKRAFIDEPENVLPVGAVLTLPAAGSESSENTVIKFGGTKFATGGWAFRPRFAFVNPELCFTLPKSQIGYGASDIFAHLLERYFSPQENVVGTDRLLEGAMLAMLEIAPKVYANNQSYEYWAEFCWLGTMAHNGMLCMGRDVQDWATHRIENKVISGVYDVAHGAGLAIIFPAWMKFVAKRKPAKIQQFAQKVMGTKNIDAAIAGLETWFKSIGLPTRLSELNLDINGIKENAQKFFAKDVVLGGYGELSLQDILKVIDLAR